MEQGSERISNCELAANFQGRRTLTISSRWWWGEIIVHRWCIQSLCQSAF